MCYPICGMVHIKEPLLLIGKSSPGGSRFLLSLSEWSYTILLITYDVLLFYQWEWEGKKEGNVLFNDVLNTFYLRLYGKGPLSQRGNLLQL